MNPVDPAEEFLSGATQIVPSPATGEALKNGAYGVSGWYVANTSLLARERFRQFKKNVQTKVPGWDEGFTLLLLSEAVMEPREHMPGVKALEIPFNTILQMNAESLGPRLGPRHGNRRIKLSERMLGLRLVGLGVSAEQDAEIRDSCARGANGAGTYDDPTRVAGKLKKNGGARA